MGLRGAGALQSGLQVTTHLVCTSAQEDYMITCTVYLVHPASFLRLQYLTTNISPSSMTARAIALAVLVQADDPGLGTSTGIRGYRMISGTSIVLFHFILFFFPSLPLLLPSFHPLPWTVPKVIVIHVKK